MDNIAIRVEGLSKKYSIGKQKDGSLRGSLGALFSGGKSNTEDFWALKDVSFDVLKGEVVGIIGKNGAGKSTLLKILSQITRPSEGSIEINGRIASLLEVGTGFHPELTGRENVYLNGTILGMTRKEVKARFDEIVEFSGIEKFIDTPVKHYSSGMYVRLAFAVAAHLEPEILIIDEVLAVGDAQFQKKCLGKMKDVAGQGRTVLFVSHDISAVATLCTKGVLLVNNTIAMHGEINAVIETYLSSLKNDQHTFLQEKEEKTYIKSIEILTGEMEPSNSILYKQPFFIRLENHLEEKPANMALGLTVYNELKIAVFTSNVELDEYDSETILGEISDVHLVPGVYTIEALLHIPFLRYVDRFQEDISFEIINDGNFETRYGTVNKGLIHSPVKWKNQ